MSLKHSTTGNLFPMVYDWRKRLTANCYTGRFQPSICSNRIIFIIRSLIRYHQRSRIWENWIVQRGGYGWWLRLTCIAIVCLDSFRICSVSDMSTGHLNRECSKRECICINCKSNSRLNIGRNTRETFWSFIISMKRHSLWNNFGL